jgi:hypothetical protein
VLRKPAVFASTVGPVAHKLTFGCIHLFRGDTGAKEPTSFALQ